MSRSAFCAAFGIVASALAETPAPNLWGELTELRQSLPGYRQEFEVTQSVRRTGASQAFKRLITIDGARNTWRERTGGIIRIFDGAEVLRFEDDGSEYERTKRKPKDPVPLPAPYFLNNTDWSKAVELERRPCGYKDDSRPCVLLEAPLRKWSSATSAGKVTQLLEGKGRALLDLKTGLIVAANSSQIIENPNSRYRSDTVYVLQKTTFAQAPEAIRFALPERGMKEVRELARWDAPRIRKMLAGKPAPDFSFQDLAGKPVTLASLKGKVVLLDFWTTWCAPCRADAPALDALHKKYGDRDLAVIGISVGEDRDTVEKFLKSHPHDFPVVLTSENEMPRPYEIGSFPTYLVISREGVLYSAVEGDQGFAELRKLLKKAGLEVE